jgi:hypothetical protein
MPRHKNKPKRKGSVSEESHDESAPVSTDVAPAPTPASTVEATPAATVETAPAPTTPEEAPALTSIPEPETTPTAAPTSAVEATNPPTTAPTSAVETANSPATETATSAEATNTPPAPDIAPAASGIRGILRRLPLIGRLF